MTEACMARALELAERGRGRTAPNPCVGAVLARGAEIVAEGWHDRYGGPHAEPACLAHARERGIDPAGCDLYVTLEPCNHHGKTPPCTQAILAAGIRRVVVGLADPNPMAAGGAEFLRAQGVEVVTGVLEAQCRESLADFLVWQATSRPYVILKLAQTLDGRIAASGGKPEAVSGPESFRRVQGLRARSEAVMVGAGTLRADNPRLTCRTGHVRGADHQPLAVAVGSLPAMPQAASHLFLLQGRAGETVFLTAEAQADSATAHALRGLGCRVWGLPEDGGVLQLAPGLERLRREAGVFTLLCEGGGGLAARLLDQGLVDELRIFLAPLVLGDDLAVASFHGLARPTMAQAARLRFVKREPSGEDLELTLRPVPQE